eukprot:s1592_g6.t1
MASKEAQELHRFGTKPAANFDADDDQPTTARSVQLGVCLGALAARGGSERAARLDVGARVGLAASCEGRNDGGIQCELGAMPKGQDVRHDFDAPLVGDRNVKIHVCEAHVACDPRASFAADARDGMLQGQRTGGEHARHRTGGAVVAERVEHTVAAASARCEREGESQAPELRTGNGHVIAGGKNVEGAGGELPCLREQQRTRRRSEDASHTRAHRTHGQRRAAIPRTARGRQYGNVETGGRSKRCVAVNAGGAETEPSEPLSELGSAEAGGRKGGVVYTGDALEEPVLVIALAAEMARDERIELDTVKLQVTGSTQRQKLDELSKSQETLQQKMNQAAEVPHTVPMLARASPGNSGFVIPPGVNVRPTVLAGQAPQLHRPPAVRPQSPNGK